MTDRPVVETDAINVNSARYFEHPDNREFWLNRPFSHPETAGKHLERFGHLLSTMSIREGDRVVDFGCGTGWTSIMLARMGAEVVAMDIAPESLAIGREASLRQLPEEARARLSFRTYGGDAIELDDASVDFVIVYDAFHHFPNPKTILEEFHRILGPQGRFGFAEPGIGHAETTDSLSETEHGILEQDLDLEQFYRSAMDAGFAGVELAIPALEPEVLTLPMTRMRSFLRGLSWIVPQDFVRKAVLTGPIGVFRKGRYAVTSLNPRSHFAEIVPQRTNIEAHAGESFSIQTRVRNLSNTVWLTEGRRGRGFVRLGAHLRSPTGDPLQVDYGRAAIPRDMKVGDVSSVEIELEAPSEPGDYLVALDMVNEGVCWFEQQGSLTATVSLSVSTSKKRGG